MHALYSYFLINQVFGLTAIIVLRTKSQRQPVTEMHRKAEVAETNPSCPASSVSPCVYLVCTVLGQQLERLFFHRTLLARQDSLPTRSHCWGASPTPKCHYQLQQKGRRALPRKLRSWCGQQASLPSLLEQGKENSDERKGFFVNSFQKTLSFTQELLWKEHEPVSTYSDCS